MKLDFNDDINHSALREQGWFVSLEFCAVAYRNRAYASRSRFLF